MFIQIYSSQQVLQKEFGQAMAILLRFVPTRHYFEKFARGFASIYHYLAIENNLSNHLVHLQVGTVQQALH